jgi:hypothetical protein
MGILVDVWLYGPLAQPWGRKDGTPGYAHVPVELSGECVLRDLLNRLGLPTEERGLTFINGKLTATPGTQPDLETVLKHNDRIALFHLKSMWPFQYRDGAQVSSALAQRLRDRGPSHAP